MKVVFVFAEDKKWNRLCLYEHVFGRYLAVQIAQSIQEPLALCGVHRSGTEPTSSQVNSPGHTLIALSNLALLKEPLSPTASFFWKIPVPLKPDA